jgi:hypothetical protein
MQGYDQEVVPLPPLDGAASPRPALVPSAEKQLEEPLYGDKSDREDQDRRAQRRISLAA